MKLQIVHTSTFCKTLSYPLRLTLNLPERATCVCASVRVCACKPQEAHMHLKTGLEFCEGQKGTDARRIRKTQVPKLLASQLPRAYKYVTGTYTIT